MRLGIISSGGIHREFREFREVMEVQFESDPEVEDAGDCLF
jgi:hypothetical protein